MSITIDANTLPKVMGNMAHLAAWPAFQNKVNNPALLAQISAKVPLEEKLQAIATLMAHVAIAPSGERDMHQLELNRSIEELKTHFHGDAPYTLTSALETYTKTVQAQIGGGLKGLPGSEVLRDLPPIEHGRG